MSSSLIPLAAAGVGAVAIAVVLFALLAPEEGPGLLTRLRSIYGESTEEELYSTQLRLHDRETFLIGKIQEAIRRINTGEIDECEECSEPIGFKRLLARPVTTLCFECKTAREQVEADESSD